MMDYPSDQPIDALPNPSVQVERKRAIAYSMDTLIPGFYCWTPLGSWQIGGSVAEASYPGMIHSRFGVALVLPEYRIFTTYRDSYGSGDDHDLSRLNDIGNGQDALLRMYKTSVDLCVSRYCIILNSVLLF